jgi:hypothetical protein
MPAMSYTDPEIALVSRYRVNATCVDGRRLGAACGRVVAHKDLDDEGGRGFLGPRFLIRFQLPKR